MRPIAVFQHAADVAPGYFVEWLQASGLPFRILHPYLGEAVPDDPRAFSGLCFMGGPMSVNDPLPWLEDELRLIRAADRAGVPVIGHCLGGQLLAKALGAPVVRHPVKEIGWGEVRVTDADAARPWLGEGPAPVLAFHWHGETFSLPPGATRILESEYCANQAFVLDDRHIAMQCHVEMTPEMVRSWCASGAGEIARSACASVQGAEEIQAHLQARAAALNAVASRLYDRWIGGLKA